MNDQQNQHFQMKLNENLALQIGQMTMQISQLQTRNEFLELENRNLKNEIEKTEIKSR